MRERLYHYLCERPEGARSQELLRLLFSSPGSRPEVGHRVVHELVGGDPRFCFDPAADRWRACRPSSLDLPLRAARFVVVDLETTGRAPGSDGIIEIGAVRVERGTIGARFTSLVNPGQPVPPFVSRLTGIATEDVMHAPPLLEVLPRFLAFAGDDVLVAHNASFDVGFLDREARVLCGRPLERPALCTLRLARRLLPELRRRSLDALGAYLGIPCRERHRALGDALIAARILLAFLEMAAARGVATVGELLDFQHRGAAESSRVLRQRLEALPCRPGVYRMLGEGGRTLLVGCAGDLRGTVGHFLAGAVSRGERRARWAGLVRDVAWTECGSRLEAALLEARLVRTLKPSYNRARRYLPRLPFVKLTLSSSFPRLLVTRRLSADRAVYVGPFRTWEGAERAAEVLAGLCGLRTCPGRLTPRPQGGVCRRGEQGQCSAPCAGGIEAPAYRERVKRLLALLEAGDGSLPGGGEPLGRDKGVVDQLVPGAAGLSPILTRRNFLVLLPRAHADGALVLVVLGGRLALEQAVSTAADMVAVAALVRERFAAYQQRPFLEREEVEPALIVAAWLAGPEAVEGVVLGLPEADAVTARLDELSVTLEGLRGTPGALPNIDALRGCSGAVGKPA